MHNYLYYFSFLGISFPLVFYSMTFSLVQIVAWLLKTQQTLFKKSDDFKCMYTPAFCLHVCLSTTNISGANGDQKRELYPLEPELQTVGSCNVGAGKWIQVLQKSISTSKFWVISPGSVLDYFITGNYS